MAAAYCFIGKFEVELRGRNKGEMGAMQSKMLVGRMLHSYYIIVRKADKNAFIKIIFALE